MKRQVLELAQATYQGCNNQHFTELLAEQEGIALSRSSVRRILLEAGIKSPRRRRPPKHRSRRERYPREGMLLQTDGSRHDWLEGRGPWLSLIGAIDDATGKVSHALFRYQEDAQGYFLLLRQIVDGGGIPMALYHDRHGIFERSKREPESLEEQLEGRKRATQFGRLVEELGITSIPSRSPQARGRIERLWGTFQIGWLVNSAWQEPELLRRLTGCSGISCPDITKSLLFLLLNLAQLIASLGRDLSLMRCSASSITVRWAWIMWCVSMNFLYQASLQRKLAPNLAQIILGADLLKYI